MLNEPRSNKIHAVAWQTETLQRTFEKTHRRTRDDKNNSEKHLNPGRKPKLKVSSWPSGIYVELRSQPKQPEGPQKGFFCAARLNRRRTQLCHWQRMSIHPARGLSGVLQHMWEQFWLLFFSRTSYACGIEISEQQASEILCDFIFSPLCNHLSPFIAFAVVYRICLLLLLLLTSVKVIQHEISKQLLSAGLLLKNAVKCQALWGCLTCNSSTAISAAK